jgi:beta-lactamase class A
MRKIKTLVANYLDEAIVNGTLTRASVYVDHLRTYEWFCLNPGEQFDVGSMLKVPTMMAILKMAESDKDLLAKRLRLEHIPELPIPNFPPSRTILPGSDHSIGELLEYTIIASDNMSNALLLRNMNTSLIDDLISNLGLPKIDPKSRNYPLTALEYSAFLKALYNVAYLSPESSEIAMDMLLRSDFGNGIRAGIPENVEVAHKFGEWGPPGARQFHEAGIVFAGKDPYLIVVMTQGPEISVLPEIVAGVSRVVYQQLAGTAISL